MAVVLFLISTLSFSKTLDKLTIEGLEINKSSVVLNNIALREGTEFSSVDIQRSIKSLYRLGLFSDIEFLISNEDDNSATLILKLVENKVCESVEFHGMKKLKKKELEEKISIYNGLVVSESFLQENVALLKAVYAEEGFLLVDIESELVETKVPGNVIVKFDIKEGRKVRIRKINITGNKAFKLSRIKRKLKTKEKKWFNSGEYVEDDFRLHLDSLLMYYHNKGYLDAQIAKDSVWYADNNRDIYINIELKEGKLYYTGNFYFTGNKIIEKDVLNASVAMKSGKPFSKNKFEMTKMAVANAYRNEGYLWVQVTDKNRYRGDTVDVTFGIVEGKPAIVRKIDVKGNIKTREKVIRREFQLYPGQKYKQWRMERSIRDVMQLNYFDNVNPDLRPNDDGTIDLIYTVEEKDNIGQFSAGVMYSEVDKLGGNFNITIPNFRGAGEQLDASVEFSKYRQRYSLGFLEPWIFDTPTSLSVRAFYEKNKSRSNSMSSNYNDYYSAGIEIGSGRRLKWPDDYFRIYLKYRLSWEKDFRQTDNALSDKGFEILREGLLSKLWLNIVRNDTDIPTFPNKGSILSISTQVAGIGGNYNFLKGVVSYDWYFPLFWKFVLGAKSKFGIISGLTDNTRIARSDLFATGGVYYDAPLRGYQEGQFGKYNGNHGTAMLGFSGEVRFPVLPQQLYLAGFVDMGNTWDDIGDVDISEMYTGVGVGFRLMLPMVGLIGFDFAWGLDHPDGRFGKKIDFQPHFQMQKGF